MPAEANVHASIIHIAVPMMLAGCSVPLLGLVDTAILGHLDHAVFLAAVAAGGSIMTFIGWLFAFLRMGNTGLTAQSLGRNDNARNREILAQSLGLGTVCGLILIIFSWPLLTLSVALITPSVHIRELTYEYCQIRIFAAPATFATSAAVGWLLGNGRARNCVVILLATNLLNIILDFLLIVGLKMNSAGAAWASLIAEWAGFALAIWLVAGIARAMPETKLSGIFRIEKIKSLLTVNQQLFFRTCCIVFTMAFFHAQGARMGDTVLAANAILIQLLLLIAYTQDGFANAAEALTGKAIGSGALNTFFAVTRLVIGWGYALALLATVILAGFPEQIIRIFTDLPGVHDQAMTSWYWLVWLPLASAFCFMADGIFIGTGKTRDMLDSMLIATFLVFLPCWYFTRGWGNDGLWLSYFSFLLSRSLLMGWVFMRHTRRDNWLSSQSVF